MNSPLSLLTIVKVAERTSISRRSIWRRINAKTFPPPHRHEGNAAVWLSTTIDDFVLRGYPAPANESG